MTSAWARSSAIRFSRADICMRRYDAMEHAFGRRPGFPIGVEEELLLVEPRTLALAQSASHFLERLPGQVQPDVYESLLETASGVRGRAEGAVTDLVEFRAAMRHAGATLMGAGV